MTDKEIAKSYNLQCEESFITRDIWEGSVRWTAKLDNGLTIYQDDFRDYDYPDERRYSSWTRLRAYCYEQNISVLDFVIQFRTHREIIATSKYGYYFCKGIKAALFSEQNWHHFIVGRAFSNDSGQISDIIQVQRWAVPELILVEEETRTITKENICLILNKDYR
jgi:hypothetical protein